MKEVNIYKLCNVKTGNSLSDAEEKEVFELFDSMTKNILRAQELLGCDEYAVLNCCGSYNHKSFNISRGRSYCI